jgi:hypothetical protein
VTYTATAAQQYPAHVKRTTLYGRLIGESRIVNVDFSLTHDDKVLVAADVTLPPVSRACGHLFLRW